MLSSSLKYFLQGHNAVHSSETYQGFLIVFFVLALVAGIVLCCCCTKIHQCFTRTNSNQAEGTDEERERLAAAVRRMHHRQRLLESRVSLQRPLIDEIQVEPEHNVEDASSSETEFETVSHTTPSTGQEAIAFGSRTLHDQSASRALQAQGQDPVYPDAWINAIYALARKGGRHRNIPTLDSDRNSNFSSTELGMGPSQPPGGAEVHPRLPSYAEAMADSSFDPRPPPSYRFVQMTDHFMGRYGPNFVDVQTPQHTRNPPITDVEGNGEADTTETRSPTNETGTANEQGEE